MSRRTLATALLAGLLLTGSITLTHSGSLTLSPATTHAPMGRLAAGSSVGSNATNGSASVAGALVATTTDLLYLNNTDGSNAVYARLVLTSNSALTGVTSLSVGIKNGTSQTAQVNGAAGSITQSSGSYVRLEPGSSNRIYVTQTVSVIFSGATLNMDLIVADDTAESAFARSKVVVSIT